MPVQPEPAVALPRLAPPGAGLPKIELFFARLIFRFGLRTTSLTAAQATLASEHDAILALVRGCDAATGAKRVLIRRLPGLEDSSRYWSVFMTLDHLRIVNDAISDAVSALLDGRVPPGAASTAAVKPSEDVGAEVVEAFTASCRRLEGIVAAAPTAALATPIRYAHPWFGPLDAAAWFFMAGFHLRLHRGQVERILAAA
jgi:hypothetical protein